MVPLFKKRLSQFIPLLHRRYPYVALKCNFLQSCLKPQEQLRAFVFGLYHDMKVLYDVVCCLVAGDGVDGGVGPATGDGAVHGSLLVPG